uniref:PDEase domain-containing protein n=1 Tax=Globodera rostochiensis TaxID=31243 RepID=A0A914H147_GLORO
MSSPVQTLSASQYKAQHNELNADVVLDYLLTHPGFLEAFVSGPQISEETFRRWTLKRNNKLRRDSRRQLLSGFATPAGRKNFRQMLAENTNNSNRLLYELALTVAQIAQVEQFELLIPAVAAEDEEIHSVNSLGSSSINAGGGGEEANGNNAFVGNSNSSAPSMGWLSVVRSDDEAGTIKLRKVRRQRKPPVHVLKLFDCDDTLLGEVHFYSVVNDRDSQFIQVLCTWGGVAIQFARQPTNKKVNQPTPMISPSPEDMEYVHRQRKLNSFLLDVVKSIFQDIITMDTVIMKVMNFAQKLVDADRASLFLVDNKSQEIYARIFDISQPELDDQSQYNGELSPPFVDPNVHQRQDGRKEIRFPLGKGIAGHVALTGESLSIQNAYEDERFNREIDSMTGYHTQSILCMPIFIRGSVIGVVQMVNKRSGGPFNQIDEEAFETFAIYCGLALHHAKLYEKIKRSEQKYRVALEVLAYHSVCNRDELNKLKKVKLREKIPELDLFEFNGNRLSELEKPLYAVYMFKTLFDGVISYDSDDLIRFVLTVRKNYRKVPYHNWTHGWTVAHAMFVFLRATNIFQPLETMSTPLASIYSTSVMEHHHFNQTVTILQQDGHNVLKSLNSSDYKKALSTIRHCILATDLALFFPNKGHLSAIIKEGIFSWEEDKHRTLVQAILMTACDLIATAKPWQVQTETVKVIFEEFYEQGDAERLNGREPIPMMDRTRAHELPQMQVGFMRGICIPCYEVLADVIPEAEKLRERSKYNASKWEEMAEEQKRIRETAAKKEETVLGLQMKVIGGEDESDRR